MIEKIEYMIVHVGEHPKSKNKDLVAIFLEPIEKLSIDLDESQQIEVLGQSAPPEIKQLIQFIQKVNTRNQPDKTDERNIVILKPKLDFLQLGWKYGDIIEVAFKKIKEAEDVKPKGEIL